jgi:hypothetical protein
MRVVTRGVSSSTVASDDSGVIIMEAAVVATAASKTCRRDSVVDVAVLDGVDWNDQALVTEAVLSKNKAIDVRENFMVFCTQLEMILPLVRLMQ